LTVFVTKPRAGLEKPVKPLAFAIAMGRAMAYMPA